MFVLPLHVEQEHPYVRAVLDAVVARHPISLRSVDPIGAMMVSDALYI